VRVLVAGLVLEPTDQNLELSLFLLCARGGFLDTPARCSVKCAKCNELLYLFDFDCQSRTWLYVYQVLSSAVI
jgi:hypothetical protein